jgi:hypothetical protein
VPKTGFYNAPAMSQNVPMHFDFLKKTKELQVLDAQNHRFEFLIIFD